MPEPEPAASEVVSIRQAARAARRSLIGPARQAAQDELIDRLLGIDELQGPGRIGMYLPTDGEVDLGASVDHLTSRGWQAHLPVIGPARSMVFRPWRPGESLTANRFGISEPPADGRVDLLAADLDVVVVPCVAIDHDGNRLGFGAGYYDRALSGRQGTPLTVAVAFDAQVVDAVPARDWDVAMQLVVTESTVIRPPH